MSDQKRYVIKIYDRKTGGEYEFDGEFFTPASEKGVKFKRSPEGYPIDLNSNGHERHCFKIWSGFKNWDDFETDLRKELEDA